MSPGRSSAPHAGIVLVANSVALPDGPREYRVTKRQGMCGGLRTVGGIHPQLLPWLDDPHRSRDDAFLPRALSEQWSLVCTAPCHLPVTQPSGSCWSAPDECQGDRSQGGTFALMVIFMDTTSCWPRRQVFAEDKSKNGENKTVRGIPVYGRKPKKTVADGVDFSVC